jgi:hypothetical protein
MQEVRQAVEFRALSGDRCDPVVAWPTALIASAGIGDGLAIDRRMAADG